MNRKEFIDSTLDVVIPPKSSQKNNNTLSEFANKKLPSFSPRSTGLEPYTGTWGFDQAAHLLRRTMFGATRTDMNTILQGSLSDAVEMLLTDAATPSPPINTSPTDTGAPVGTTWVNASFNNSFESTRIASLRSWWLGLMINQGISLTEKMTLFMHNHFVTEIFAVNDSRYSYQYNALLRANAMGNFRSLSRDISINPAMLNYLNGNTNTVGSPNENYARELLELFTIGKGPLIAPGDYTNYTEDDVKAAAKVLTGWRDNRTNINSQFNSGQHDKTDKQFSAAFGNKIIANNNDLEYIDLVDMIFQQAETSRNICRELYRWFVYYVIDDNIEQNVIEPLAQILRDNNYELKPVLRALFNSAHFFDTQNVGCLIKNPLDFIVGIFRQYNVVFPDSTHFTDQYASWLLGVNFGYLLQMYLGDPPNVAGWTAYYQEPAYYETWINSVTLPYRNQLTDVMISNNGYKQNNQQLIIDPMAFVQTVSDPSDPNVIISEFASLLFPISITDPQKSFLKETLLPGLPDYEWSNEWSAYQADPTNQNKLNAVKNKLQLLLKAMMDMAEYQLS